jgi:hypothetical protein
MTVSEADLEAIVVGTSQLAAALDVSTTYIADLIRQGVLEPLRKPNGTAVRCTLISFEEQSSMMMIHTLCEQQTARCTKWNGTTAT